MCACVWGKGAKKCCPQTFQLADLNSSVCLVFDTFCGATDEIEGTDRQLDRDSHRGQTQAFETASPSTIHNTISYLRMESLDTLPPTFHQLNSPFPQPLYNVARVVQAGLLCGGTSKNKKRKHPGVKGGWKADDVHTPPLLSHKHVRQTCLSS